MNNQGKLGFFFSCCRQKGAFFADYKEYHTDTNVDFNVTIVEEKLKVSFKNSVFVLIVFVVVVLLFVS